MRDEKSLVIAKKRQSRQFQMRAVFVALIFKISVGDYDGQTKYIRPEIYLISEWTGVDKIRLAILLKIHRGAEMDPNKTENLPVNEKQPLFARALTPLLQD